MRNGILRAAVLIVLATIFTGGLTFATLELPYRVDQLMQSSISTPGFDSFADESARLKTELFIAHFHLRAIGYSLFGILVVLIGAGFLMARPGVAALGAVGFMLPVFAQFAGVMFFLAGLGLLNVIWLPVLDLSVDVQVLGRIAGAPYDFIQWVSALAGVDAYWPAVIFCIAIGLLIFFLGVFAWLSARAGSKKVVDFSVYRLSRHPQYLGWILWTYGIYLLLMRGLYPKRSWGIDAGLSWLLATTVIIMVALLEELNMRKRCGETYERYRRSAPFLFPIPGFLSHFFVLPFRVLFKKDRADRASEVLVIVLSCASLVLVASSLVYGGGFSRIAGVLRPTSRAEALERMASDLRSEDDRRRRNRLAGELAEFEGPAVGHFLQILDHEDAGVRSLAAEKLVKIATPDAAPRLLTALRDPSPDVRRYSLAALERLGSTEVVPSATLLLEDEDQSVRHKALRCLASFKSDRAIGPAVQLLEDSNAWVRVTGVKTLGLLGNEQAVQPLSLRLADHEPRVRREAVIALLMIGSLSACEGLEAAADDDDWETRIYACEALKRIVKGFDSGR